MKKLLMALSFCLALHATKAQEWKNTTPKEFIDSTKKNRRLPIALGAIGVGCALEYSKHRGHWWTNKHDFQKGICNTFPGFATRADDYLRFGPMALAIGMNISGQKAEHKFMGQVIRYATAHVLMDAVVFKMKKYTAHLRPDGSSPTSFPSAHAAQAFCMARFLDKEFGKGRPWVRWIGYSMAATTGACRVLNNKHWVSDVLIGAGIGILSVDLTYFLFDKFDSKKNLMIAPMAGGGSYGLNLVYRF